MITLTNNTKGLALHPQVEEIYGKVHTSDSLLGTVLYWRINCRVKPGFIGRQGSSDRSFYVSFTALPTDTCLKTSYPFVLATNLLSDTAVKICIARVITLCSHWIKASSEKTRLVLKGFLQNGAEKKHRNSSPVYFNFLSKGFLH